MKSLPDEDDAGAWLKSNPLRDFAAAKGRPPSLPSYQLNLDRVSMPVPRLLRYALKLIGVSSAGPGEKVEWWSNFTYKGEWCELSHQKFGLRLRLGTLRAENEAQATLRQIAKQLTASVRTVEKVILQAAPELLGEGSATVVNQHDSLTRAYQYFRDGASDPTLIEDEVTTYEPGDGMILRATTFSSGQILMSMNAFHDLVAAISAYLSRLEHDLILFLPFTGFDPELDNVTDIIGTRWGDKFDRVLGKSTDALRFKQRLTDVVERWRNPYSHGGFEKGHGATIYLHAPGVGAVPIGLSSVRNSPRFSFIPAGESDIAQVFELFDELDAWMTQEHPEATCWIESGLDLRFDPGFRTELAESRSTDSFDKFLANWEHRQAVVDNMDY